MSTVVPTNYNSDLRRSDPTLRLAFEGYLRERCGALWVEWNPKTLSPRAGYHSREQDESSRWSCWLAANAWTAAGQSGDWSEVRPGMRRCRVDGGWLYEIEWQYDFVGPHDSLVGVNHTFVPDPPLMVLQYGKQGDPGVMPFRG